ncbi:glycoside hydrolase family 18 protein [Hypoxylon fuscum]|nr:glycoside hydrolase family 18 protein [Hypoxylon fuscum]
MVSSKVTLASLASILPSVLAGFDASAQTNVAIIPLSFMNGIKTPITNFANAGDNCTVFAGTQLLDCPQIEEDIKTCQDQGKTILLSIGGATYTEGGFSDSASAEAAAENVWDLFGADTTQENRPFGSSIIDGFDFDLESTTQNFVPFASKLRSLMDADTSKKYYLSAAPQCVYPDAAMNDMLIGAISFDFIMIQFYNNYCGIQSFVAGSTTQNNFNFQTWDDWAKQTSKNKDVKVLLGVPANTGAGGGYQPASALAPIISYCKQFSSFGGVMMWDMSQLYANDGFLDAVYGSLGGSANTPTTTLVTSTRATTTAPGATLVPQYGQ